MATSQTNNLSWVEQLRRAQAIMQQQQQANQLLAQRPNTAMGYATGQALAELLGNALYPKREDENATINVEGNRQAGNAFYQNRMNELDQEINRQNGNTNWENTANAVRAQDQYNFGNPDDWRKENFQNSVAQNKTPDLLSQGINNLSQEDLMKILFGRR